MKKKKIYLYGNGSFLNKGCEAITRGTVRIITKSNPNSDFISISDNPDYDRKMNIDGVVDNLNLLKGYNLIDKILNKINRKHLINIKLKNVGKTVNDSDLCISLGGDNYCYKKNYYLMQQNEDLHKKYNKKTVLWGCSIDYENIDEDIIKDIKRYNLITVRETITQENLNKKGIIDNVKLITDPAFVMDKKELILPNEWEEGNTIGINLSPMVINKSQSKIETYKNFVSLIEYILKNTNSKIALIPHVFFSNNNDYKLLSDIYNEINDSRIMLVGNMQNTAEELKYIISKCRIFIGARTHATIAAYSTGVPTLVIGYSVKAKGIAKDIFGDYKNYVLPIQEVESEEQLIKAYKFLEDNSEKMKRHLENFMPQYINRAWNAGSYIKCLLEENK